MRSRLTLLSAFGSAACAREYSSDNARCCGVRRRLMTLMGQNAHQEFGFVALMPFPDISTHMNCRRDNPLSYLCAVQRLGGASSQNIHLQSTATAHRFTTTLAFVLLVADLDALIY
ncbi:hypothetical protein J6590_014916 [Homalodisca vitripennis]|nr:hypothetical protein J6590_014916 [Homalodisca vitripennis]